MEGAAKALVEAVGVGAAAVVVVGSTVAAMRVEEKAVAVRG